MYKEGRYINAGTNEIHRWGRKAVEMAAASLKANEAGFYSIPVDGGEYWTIGTSRGKYGEFCKLGDTIFSVNGGGYAYAKAGTEKAEKFVAAVTAMIEEMHRIHEASCHDDDEEED